jgi:hypothetical protein
LDEERREEEQQQAQSALSRSLPSASSFILPSVSDSFSFAP